jgi:hypothetical protein
MILIAISVYRILRRLSGPIMQILPKSPLMSAKA